MRGLLVESAHAAQRVAHLSQQLLMLARAEQLLKPLLDEKTRLIIRRGASLEVVQIDPDLATRINVACMHRGLLMFAPVGVGGECVKISPPLSIEDDCLRESLAVFEEAVDSVCGSL